MQNQRIALLSLLLFTTPTAGALAQTAEEAIREKCRLHREAAAQTLSSQCAAADPSLTTTASDITRLTGEGKTVCEDAVKMIVEKRDELSRVTQQGTARAEEVRRQVGTGQLTVDGLSGAMGAQGNLLGEAARGVQDQNQQILTLLRVHHEWYRKVEEKERAYESLGSRLVAATAVEGGHCPQGERDQFRMRVERLDGELTSLRRELAGNVQALNSLYQRNLTALGATREQAVAIARRATNGQSLELTDTGATRDVNRSWWERLFGSSSPHEREVARVPCAPGTSDPGQACYDYVPVARTSRAEDEALSRLGGVGSLDPPRAGVGAGGETGAGVGAVASLLGGEPETGGRAPASIAGAVTEARGDESRARAFREALNEASLVTSSDRGEGTGHHIVENTGGYNASLDSAVQYMMQDQRKREEFYRQLRSRGFTVNP